MLDKSCHTFSQLVFWEAKALWTNMAENEKSRYQFTPSTLLFRFWYRLRSRWCYEYTKGITKKVKSHWHWYTRWTGYNCSWDTACGSAYWSILFTDNLLKCSVNIWPYAPKGAIRNKKKKKCKYHCLLIIYPV